jgi:hypothetical protein
MNNLLFPLTKNLIIPATGNPNKGYLLFPAGQFGLTYTTLPNPKKSQMTISLGVEDLTTNELVWILGTYNITEVGFPVPTNEAEYEAYLAEVQTAKDRAAMAAANYSSLEEQLVSNPELQEEYENAAIEYQAATDALNSIPEVTLKQEYINKYSEIIPYFNGDGTLTNEGIEWAKTHNLGGVTLDYYIT